jgi:hypothetical protein
MLILGPVLGGIGCVVGVMGLIANLRRWTNSRIARYLWRYGAAMSCWRIVLGLWLAVFPYAVFTHHSPPVQRALLALAGSLDVLVLALAALLVTKAIRNRASRQQPAS